MWLLVSHEECRDLDSNDCCIAYLAMVCDICYIREMLCGYIGLFAGFANGYVLMLIAWL